MAKKRRRVRWGRLLALLLGLLIVVGSLAAASVYGYVMLKINSVKTTSILILGLDKKTGGVQRSDTLMLLLVNPKTNKMELLSIPRDSYVEIPCLENKKDKINHAFVFGGQNCTTNTIARLLDLNKIDNYISIDFNQLIELIDLVDKVEVTPSKSFCQKGIDDKEYCFTKGETLVFDGQMALAYCRQRKIDNDIHRTQRQQEVIQALMDKAKLMNLWDLYPLAIKCLELSDTDLDIVQIAAFYRTIKAEDFAFKKEVVKGKDAQYYSPGTGGTQYMYEIDSQWLSDYIDRLKKMFE